MDSTNLLLLILFLGITSITVFASNEPQDSSFSRSALIKTRENKRFKGRVVKQFYSPKLTSCSHSCLRHVWCTSSNFKTPSANNDKGLCELFKHEVSVMSEDTELFEERPGVTFSMLLKVMCHLLLSFVVVVAAVRCSCCFYFLKEKKRSFMHIKCLEKSN